MSECQLTEYKLYRENNSFLQLFFMIQRMYISQNFSLLLPFAFIILIPFLLYYSMKTIMSPPSPLKQLPTHHDYRLPDFLISSHVDKSKYIRRRMKLKQQIKRREEAKYNECNRTNRNFDNGNQNFLGRCSIGLAAYAEINEQAEQQKLQARLLPTKIVSLPKFSRKDSKKKINYGFEPTKLTIIHEDAQY